MKTARIDITFVFLKNSIGCQNYIEMQKYSTSLSYSIALSAFREEIDKSGLATNHTIDFKQWCCHMTPNNATQMHKG